MGNGGGRTIRRVVVALVGGLVSTAALAACGSGTTGDDTTRSAPTSAGAPAPGRSPTPTPTPTPTRTTPAVTQPESRTVDAGAVTEGATGNATGSGSANVHYRRGGDFAVVVTLDCSACTGTATVTAAGRMSPFGRAAAPLTGSFLMDVFEDGAPDQTFIVQATGSWTVTLRNWNDLTPVNGPQSGAGPAVLYFADDVSKVHVDYTPARSGDTFSARVFTVSKATRVFGDSKAFSEDFEADLPGVIAIQTNGTWTVTPLG